jgi:hypothetical protein
MYFGMHQGVVFTMKFDPPAYRRFLIFTFGSFILCFAGMVGVNAALDPLHILHGPANQDAYDSESRYAMPGMILNNKAPVAVLGSSVVQNFDEAYYFEKTGLHLSRYFLTGGTAYEQRRLVETLLSAQHAPQTILWGIAPTSYFNADINSIRWTSFPEYLFAPEPSVMRYLFSFETFNRALRQIPARLAGRTQSESERFTQDHEKFPLGQDSIYRSYCGPKMNERIARLFQYDYTMMQEQIEHNLAAVIAAHPNVKFILFLPPYSLVQFAEFDKADVLGEVMAFRVILAETAKRFPNTSFYDFQADIDMISDDADYSDSIHYGAKTTRAIIDVLASGKAPPVNIDEHNARLQKAVDDNAEQIWRGIANFCEHAGQPLEVEVQKLSLHKLHGEQAQPE